MSFAMRIPQNLFITGCVLKPKSIDGGVSKQKNWTSFCVNEFSLNTTDWCLFIIKIGGKSVKIKDLGLLNIIETENLHSKIIYLIYYSKKLCAYDGGNWGDKLLAEVNKNNINSYPENIYYSALA